MQGAAGGHPSVAKAEVRARVLAGRRGRPAEDRARDAEAIADHALAWAPLRAARTVAAYVAVGSEPGTGPLLDRLRSAGVRLLLPVLLLDGDLDWAAYDGSATLVAGHRGLREPAGPPLGVDAVAGADVVLVPGLAASPTGARLGRGGGSYDRALARVASGVPVAVVLHAAEVGLAVPVEAHDRPVTHALTPDGVVRLTPPA